MIDIFTVIGHKYSIGIAAMVLAILLLLPSSFGSNGARLIEQAFGQFNSPSSPEDGAISPSPPEQTTTPSSPQPTPPPPRTANGLTFLERGLVGSVLSIQNPGDAANVNSYVVNGRFRLYVNQSLLQRFIAEMTLAPTDGSALNNVTIEQSAPHRFEITPNGTTPTATPTGSIPPFSSRIVARISINTIPAIDNVPMTISTRGQVLAIQGISIDESRIIDTTARDVLSTINGQTIYGTISR
jgi:hypothetical protein